ncbi:MAG: T9SS type A sorting domain-containing protein [Saprospiraceae bacterium]|nr:T9SS type A sorting domain-containing protein [Saprospiraceae bacterium]
MQQSLQRSFFLFAALMLANTLFAQTPFWSENFTNGLPSSWSTTDGSNQGVLWTWCADPLLGDSNPGCSEPWDDALNAQVPFNSATASTGFMVMDSDDPGGLPTPHVSRLTTSAIDCSGKSQVFLTFQTHIGVFELDADANAILRVSTNGTTWTDYTIFNGLTTTVRWSENPEIPIIDISATAANAGTVYLQWQWTGNWEYMWSVDDVELYDQNPTPGNDMAISAFFYPVSSFASPASQIATDTFSFEVNLTNNGLNPQTNIVVTAYVKEDGGATLHTQTITIPELAAGVQDTAFLFPQLYAPELQNGVYLIGYTLTSDSLDQRPNDNERESPFVVSNDFFAKEDGPEQGYRPSAGGDWAVGNLYRMGAGAFDMYKATEAEFAFTSNDDEIPVGEVEAAIYLFKISNDVAPDFSNFDGSGFLTSSMEWLGVASYEAPDSLQGYQIQRVELSDLNTALPGVVLEPNTRYLLAVEYGGANASVFHAFNDDVYYYFPSTFIFNTDWNPFGFGGDVNAVLRLYISLVSTTDETVLPDNTIKVFPNPVRETVQLGIEFAEPTDATITIADINGRVIHVEDRQALTQETLQYRLPQLASGTYLARIATAKGTLTKKFVVQK